MQRGIIRSFDKITCSGMIGRTLDVDIKFYADRVLGRDRQRLALGDQVWFEVEQINHIHVAINIRKCA